jgi:hypothetical protein
MPPNPEDSKDPIFTRPFIVQRPLEEGLVGTPEASPLRDQAPQEQINRLEARIRELEERLTDHTSPEIVSPSLNDTNTYKHPHITTFKVRVKGAAPADTDYIVPLGSTDAADGIIILDNVNDKLYVRTGGAWLSATLT